MTHIEIKNLSKELDVLLQYVADNKITNAYLNYGLIRNAKILTKATKLIEEVAPQRLKELETTMFQEGYKKFLKLLADNEGLNTLSEADKNNKIFSMGYMEASQEDKEERDTLTKDYNTFLELEDDTELYYIKLEGIKDIDMELRYWAILDNFIKD